MRGVLRALVVLTCCGFARPAHAQWVWEPVTDAERQQSAGTVDANAGAEALFRRIKVEDLWTASTFKSVRDEYIRIKVFTQLAADGLTQVQIPFRERGVRVTDVAARTLLPDGTVLDVAGADMKTIKLARKDGRELRAITFAMPKLQPGAIMEYRYRATVLDNLTDGEALDVQMSVPIKRAEIDVKPLLGISYRLEFMPFSLVANIPTEAVKGWYHCLAENVRGLPSEPYSPLGRRQRGFLYIYYLHNSINESEKFWGQVASYNAKRVEEQAGTDADVAALARQIVGDAQGDSLKLQRLVRWCRREIRPMTGEEFGQRARRYGDKLKIADMLEERVGTDRDAAQVLAALASAAGLPSQVVFLESRSGMPFRQSVLTTAALSVAAVLVRCSDHERLYSARARGVGWDQLPWDAEGAKGILCAQDSLVFMTSQISAPSPMTRQADLKVLPSGDLEGRISIRLGGHWAEEWLDRMSNDGDPRAVLQGMLRWEKGGPTLAEVSAITLGSDSDTVVVSTRLTWPGYATVTGKRIVLQPAIWSARQPAVFTASSRQTPVELPFAWLEDDSVHIELPAGCTLEGGDRVERFEAEPLAYHDLGVARIDGPVLEFRRVFRCGSADQLTYSRANYGSVKKAFDAIGERDQYTLTFAKAAP